MNQKILSMQALDEIEKHLKWFNENIEQFYIDFDNTIKAFELEGVVESFYISGQAGQQTKENIIKLRNAVKQYIDSISMVRGLIGQTHKFVESQRSVLSSAHGAILRGVQIGGNTAYEAIKNFAEKQNGGNA